MLDERMELLITRYLDGEIAPADRVVVERAVAADPAVAALVADYQRIDEQSRAALRSVCMSPRPTVLLTTSPRWRWLRPAGILAAAACVVLVVGVFGPGSRPRPPAIIPDLPGEPVVMGDDPAVAGPRVNDRRPANLSDGPMFDAVGNARMVDYVAEPPVQRRITDRRQTRDWVGVVGDDGELYLIELNRQRTNIVPVSGDY